MHAFNHSALCTPIAPSIDEEIENAAQNRFRRSYDDRAWLFIVGRDGLLDPRWLIVVEQLEPIGRFRRLRRLLTGPPEGSLPHPAFDPVSFEADVISGLPQLRRYARALTGDASWADDLVQDTAERALVRHQSFRRDSNLRAWLFKILRNLYIDQLRARREFAVDDETAPWRNLEAPCEEVDGLMLRDVQRALYHLSAEQREVLLLIGVEELTYHEASIVLGVPIGTVMSRLSRAREHMRMLLGGESAPKSAALKVVRMRREP